MDWYVLLTPLLLLPIVSLLVFVGCGLEETGLAVPVKIHYAGDTFTPKPDAQYFEFWCEYTSDAPGLHHTSRERETYTQLPFDVLLALGGPFEKGAYTCTLIGLAWRGDPDPFVIPPISRPFTEDSTLKFELKIILQPDGQPAEFGFYQPPK